ncbi:hypothetical protein JZ751_009709 [Albula glossodonta]|uniref:Uncharacterized protein n=1 Tax=Albula glossodonta TaxID=121402 RepID=A0A8T2P0A8_9TELE|nr:hypothetical protein JZ751_009709 [Albula glossodonta]
MQPIPEDITALISGEAEDSDEGDDADSNNEGGSLHSERTDKDEESAYDATAACDAESGIGYAEAVVETVAELSFPRPAAVILQRSVYLPQHSFSSCRLSCGGPSLERLGRGPRSPLMPVGADDRPMRHMVTDQPTPTPPPGLRQAPSGSS